jgi:hypothetical protein
MAQNKKGSAVDPTLISATEEVVNSINSKFEGNVIQTILCEDDETTVVEFVAHEQTFFNESSAKNALEKTIESYLHEMPFGYNRYTNDDNPFEVILVCNKK